MIQKKITCGFVVQSWDTELKKWVAQEFIAGHEVEYEDENGYPLLDYNEEIRNHYLPFEMRNPSELDDYPDEEEHGDPVG